MFISFIPTKLPSHLPVLLLVFLLLFLLLTALLLGLLRDALVVSVLGGALQHLWTVGPHRKLLAVCKRPGRNKRNQIRWTEKGGDSKWER